MKNFLFAFTAGCISAVAITTGAYSQPKADIASLEAPKHTFKPVAIVPESGNAIDMSAITNKAVKESKKSFKDLKSSYNAVKNFKLYYQTANDEKWYKTSEGFLVTFTYDGATNRICYSEKGRWAASVKAYSEDHANPAVIEMFRSEYPRYKIEQVEEIATSAAKNTPTYLVYAEDANNIKIVRISGEQMDVYQEFERQK